MQLKNYASNARALGAYGRAAALSWAARWGWSPGIVLDAVGVMGGKSRGMARALAGSGLLRGEDWTYSTHVKHYYTLTAQGRDYLFEHLDAANEIAAEFDYPKITIPEKSPRFQTGIAVHNLFVQMLTIIALIDEKQYGRPSGYKTNIECARMRKIPDAIIERKNGISDYIEFEYSKKSHAEIQNFLVSYYMMLNQPGAEKDRATVYFASKELMSSFARFWKPGEILSTFERNEKGQWIKEIIPTELPDGPYMYRLRLVTARWSDLLSRLQSLPRLSLPAPAAPVTPASMMIPGIVDW
jgi:hypothetical protein